ncbi:MAG TPA: bifunctional riboflavin kinase/FAD synthetase [Prolixibacteraceae bacterium]|nr:bifunctional riboflavin kinase/FAD synthetase [Prolixibacteraceae bacterium]HPS13576.1 bifunctional riboflavin kinase/FAD synthetase [Prolixibacteraceae bacterium]
MKIHDDIDLFDAVNPVITIGTFDGVHLGHRKVIDQLNRIADSVGGESVVFTFYPHPRLVVSASESNLRLLSSFAEKASLLEKAGVDHLVVYPFTIDFAELTYDQFIKRILIDKLHLHTLVLGHDHRLGKNREGTYDNVVSLAQTLSFGVEKIDTFLVDQVDISSSKIRTALQKGDVEKATRYLGYPYSLKGTVVEGNKIGRQMGFPTANLVSGDPFKLIPLEGVYAVTVLVDGVFYRGMLNIGFRPTLEMNADHRTIEVNIFDFDQDIYQKEITLFFHYKIRSEQKFESIEKLKLQLIQDRDHIMKMLTL